MVPLSKSPSYPECQLSRSYCTLHHLAKKNFSYLPKLSSLSTSDFLRVLMNDGEFFQLAPKFVECIIVIK